MIECRATVRNQAGIHCRPSAVIVDTAKLFRGSLCVRHGPKVTDLRSVMGLLSLGLEEGDRISIEVNGGDEVEICRELVSLFERRFDFPSRGAAAG